MCNTLNILACSITEVIEKRNINYYHNFFSQHYCKDQKEILIVKHIGSCNINPKVNLFSSPYSPGSHAGPFYLLLCTYHVVCYLLFPFFFGRLLFILHDSAQKGF